MQGNSKLLTMAAIGVIGVGAAMPYWSRSELSSPSSAAVPRVDAFIGQEQQPAAAPEFVLPEIRKAVSLDPGSGGGLDIAVAATPNLADEYPTAITPSSTPQQLVDLSPSGYQRVSVARHEPRENSVESFAIPVEMPAGDVYRVPEPRQIAAPRSQVAPEVEAPSVSPPQQPGSRWQPQTTSIVANKPVLPASSPQSTPAPAPRSFVPQPQSRPQAPAQPRRRHRLVDGDTLPQLAERYLGSADMAWAIFEANRNVLSDPQLLPLKVEITIPGSHEIGAGPQVQPSGQPGSVSAASSTMRPLVPLGTQPQPQLRMVPLNHR
ncbi:LysM peptidoglycan-binding domain-containing protein [Blastopirellula retiformator]|uniref:LysM domain/BON superfamily protein n=1 Tax=Blastopirellula retiformator TaxID=2527970 RepID=A0A5C5V1K0_9BACT|nr:hypothetical protein [Blastopirellula retiformator]TWT31612.1 LysM domain/BON superfamily protein [Blastopirellula retiformator]